MTAAYSLSVADWRHRVHELYGEVRELAADSGGEAAHDHWVRQRNRLFEEHPASPRAAGQQLRHAPYDPRYRFEVAISVLDNELDNVMDDSVDGPDRSQRLEVPTGTDGVVPFDRIGHVTLDLPEGPETLAVWWLASYGGGVFIPFRDGTAGRTTYGAGRYLIDTVKGADLGRVGSESIWVLDLNFAYNPSCVYDYRWACPLAPPDNRLTAPVPVGELLPDGYPG